MTTRSKPDKSNRYGLSLFDELLDVRGTSGVRSTDADRGLSPVKLDLKLRDPTPEPNPLLQKAPTKKDYPSLLRAAVDAAFPAAPGAETDGAKTLGQLKELGDLRSRTSGASADPPGTHTLNLPPGGINVDADRKLTHLQR